MDSIEISPDIIEIGDLHEEDFKLNTDDTDIQLRPSVNFGSV